MAFYRVHTQADWPRTFRSLAAAISYINYRQPLWYQLDAHEGDDMWQEVVTREQSRAGRRFGDHETEESENLRAGTERTAQSEHQQASTVGRHERIDVI